MYHGTDINTGKSIVEEQLMLPSRGDHHWLGDGIYFYEDIKYAFRWIVIRYTDNFRNLYAKDYGDIFQEYIILKADILSNRKFDLDDVSTKLFFINVKNKIQKKSQYSKRIQDQLKENGIADGVVFNVLFDKMGYNNKYDYVSATFPIAYLYDSNSRLDYIPELQICVKNAEIIKNIIQCNDKDNLPEYKAFIDLYRNTKRQMIKPHKEKVGCIKNCYAKGKVYYRKGGGRNGFQK